MKCQTASVLAAGLAIMAVTAWLTYPTIPNRFEVNSSKFKFMHYTGCDREQNYDPIKVDQPCLYCEKRLVGTMESIKLSGKPNPYGRMFIFLYAELLVLIAAAWTITRKRIESTEVDYLCINCEKCRQKIRYREQKIGQVAICRRCKHTFHYPEASRHEYYEVIR